MTSTRCSFNAKTNHLLKDFRTNKNNNKFKQLKLNKRKKLELNKISTGEKLLCCSSYFTFGLSGLLYILFNFLTTKTTSKFTMFHTIQAISFGIFTAMFVFTIKTMNLLLLTLLPSLTITNTIESNLLPYLNIIIFCMAGILSLTSFYKGFLILPGIKNIAKQIIN